MKYSVYKINFLFVALFLLCQCKREVPLTKLNTGSYIKVMSQPGNQEGRFVKPAPDGGFLIFSYGNNQPGDGQTLVVRKTNELGVVQWQEVYAGDILSGAFKQLDNGNTLLVSYDSKGNFLSFDPNGKLMFKNNFQSNVSNLYSEAFCIENSTSNKGTFLIGASNGVYGGTSNYVWKMNANGSLRGRITLVNFVDIWGKILGLKVYGYEDPDTYYVLGQHLPKTNWSWSDIDHTFVAKIHYDTDLRSTKTVTLDPANVTHLSNEYIAGKHLTYSDNSVLISVNQFHWVNRISRTHFFRVDKDLNLVWEKFLQLENASQCFVSSMTRCKDGNLLFSGWMVPLNEKNRQPFICKTDSEINMLWQKVFTTTLGGSANCATEMSNGNIVVTGETLSFGGGSMYGDVFLIQTNSMGEVE